MLGVYGGTFNPVHYGHLRTAFEVKEFFRLHEIRLIPCRIPAHREAPAVSAELRLQMLQLAIADLPGWIADRRELDRSGPSYMVDTLASLRDEFPEQAIVLFMGADAFEGIESWHRWADLFLFAHVVVMTRPGYQTGRLSSALASKITDDADRLRSTRKGALYFHNVTPLAISSSKIRQLIAAGCEPKFLMPDEVIQAIYQHNLYQQTGL